MEEEIDNAEWEELRKYLEKLRFAEIIMPPPSRRPSMEVALAISTLLDKELISQEEHDRIVAKAVAEEL